MPMTPIPPLLPRPKRVRARGGGFELPDDGAPMRIAAEPDAGRALCVLARELGRAGRRFVRVEDLAQADLALAVQPGAGLPPQGYRLTVGRNGARVVGADPAGAYYGACTLGQLVESAEGALPALEIVDEPDFPSRGVLLDVSRDRVPTMETLFELVDLLSSWKVNALQLYTEHTFAYRGHERVWEGSGALTADEIRALDAHCAERFVELVPNQQSFGHMHRWLVHEPYRALAECPGGIEHPFSRGREPFSLCPLDPACLELLEDLYDQLLPCFTSRSFHVGLDETFDLGRGRSERACRERGVGAVFLDYLREVHRRVAARGRRMQFWGDVLSNHPELAGELPRDAVVMLWGYGADHPFEEQAALLGRSGLEFHVCPGTASWQSFAGRPDTMLSNVAAAICAGRGCGASGVLVTDWGDRGHLQPLPVSFPGWIAAAAMAWNATDAERPDELDLAGLLDRFALHDPTGAAGRALLELGRAGEGCGGGATNGTAPFFVLALVDDPLPGGRLPGIAIPDLERAAGRADAALADLARARPGGERGGLLVRELAWAGAMVGLGARLGIERLRAGPGSPVTAIPAGVRGELADELRAGIEEHRSLWLERCRRGGLPDSTSWLERVLGRLGA